MTNLKDSDLIDWGVKEKYKKEIGIGECAGVTIDLVQTLLFDAKESFDWATEAYKNKRYSDAIYHAYNARIRGAKAVLTRTDAKINSQASIIAAFDPEFPEYESENKVAFKDAVLEFKKEEPSKSFTYKYVEQTQPILLWIENRCHANIE